VTVEGLDLSHWDRVNEYSLAGKGFVVIKLTEGSGYVDPAFSTHLAKALAAKVIVGAYHWARNDAGIDAQARFFVSRVPAGVTFLAVDNEGTAMMGTYQLAALINAIRKYDARNLPILLYMSDSQFKAAGQDYNWVAKWSSTPPARRWLLWQYSSGSHNTSGEDQDRFAGSLTELRGILGVPIAPDSGTAQPVGDSMKLTAVQDQGGSAKLDADGPVWRVADGAQVNASKGAEWLVVGSCMFDSPGLAGTTLSAGYMIAANAADHELHVVAKSRVTFTPDPKFVDDGYTKETQDAAVAAQAAADKAALDAALAEAQAALATAAETERKRIAAAEAVRIASI
jgi:signal transduction histidine kinase